ncbi:flap endonuclease [Simiduia sp. 21SJ11W-1]|uniref:5'-3' exonuclease n=1 Tax=Simiduia sp. 21SJ11W-1 TaxID=2909669 RepID=UPI0020A16858|nr:5'-3' exonuclease H3TH domain-containing protein [Simiduia sp. 21SJ11W-1]UTA46568.1 flap endonuclease [Simiduia sp. 21SJ11W-1]
MVITKKSKPPAKRWLVDASIYIFRAYFSLPPNWESRDGFDTEAVYGFTNFLLDLRIKQPSHVGVCFDEGLETGFRHRLYPDYKASRALPDEALAYQLNACRAMAEALGFACFASEEYEADDLIGCLLQCLVQEPAPVAILTRDKDLGQLLVREQDYLWDYAADTTLYRPDIFEKFGVWPEQLVDYLALVGDASDDIPGVAGVGKKTAAQMLANNMALDTLLAEPAQFETMTFRGARSMAKKLAEYREQIALAKQLAAIVSDVALVKSHQCLVPKPIDEVQVAELLAFYGIGGLRKKLARAVGA